MYNKKSILSVTFLLVCCWAIFPSIASSTGRHEAIGELAGKRSLLVNKQNNLKDEKKELVRRWKKIKDNKQYWYRKCRMLQKYKGRIIANIGYDNFQKRARYCVGKYKNAKRTYARYGDRIKKRYRMNKARRNEIDRKISSIDLSIIQLKFGSSSYDSTHSTQGTTDTNTGSKGESSGDDQGGVFDGDKEFFKKNRIVVGREK